MLCPLCGCDLDRFDSRLRGYALAVPRDDAGQLVNLVLLDHYGSLLRLELGTHVGELPAKNRQLALRGDAPEPQ
ncbi:MAG TPA: hypothetical protein VG826_29545 [Pirellulales bacterium]|nr:hypothetical protein [Pirellulales bacterium]